MKASVVSFIAFLANANSYGYLNAFTPNSVTRSITLTSQYTATRHNVVHNKSCLFSSKGGGAAFIGMDDDDDEEDDDEEDEDEDDVQLSSTRYSGAKSPFTGVKLDPWDPKPLIKPRPSRYFKDEISTIDDKKLFQSLSQEERRENLTVMRQIQKNDLPDLRRRKDHAGWVEANNDLKRRLAKDPWFGVNDRLRNAIQLGESDENVTYLQELATKLGGAPPGITVGDKGYAVHTEIYDIPLSPNRAASVLDREIRLDRAARGRTMMAERKKNIEKQERQYEEDLRNPGLREDREARERRERTMRRLLEEIDKDNQKKRERAKEILGKLPDTPESRTKSMEKALQEARDEVKRMRRKQLGDDSSAGDESTIVSGTPASAAKSGADKAREAAAAEAAGGRPRLPGDADVTRGELGSLEIKSSSTTVTGPIQVEVSSVYNKDQSDPPMRKHCFQYTIRITNNSKNDETIQLLGRRFEIQTVGSSMKDVVEGEGVTGRTPVLKPGEVFEYTSTAPLSVRPIGTTIIAARMRGEYRYVVLPEGGTETTSTSDEKKASLSTGNEAKAELGTFHFVFPDDQHVKPFRSDTEDDDDDEDDDEPTSASSRSFTPSPSAGVAASAPSSSTASTSSASTRRAPASSLPGDNDIQSGIISAPLNDSSEATTDGVKVQVTSSYRPERSDAGLDKHCFAYNIRITNESNQPIQLVSRRFEIQTVGSSSKDVVQGPGVTGRQPILKPGESFEYTSTAPLSVKPMLDKTPVVARMKGEYNFITLQEDATTPVSSTPKNAFMKMFHFILPALV